MAAKKTATKKPATKKPAVKKATAKKEAVDLIQVTAHEVENLTYAKADKLVAVLQDTAGESDFKLGGIFSRIIEEGWYTDAGFETARDMFEGKYGVKYRKAMYLVNIYRVLVDSEVKWSQVRTIGWTKLRVICKIMDKDNAKEWIATAKKKGMTVIELDALVRAALEPDSEELGDEETDATSDADSNETTTTKTFKLHSDQLEVVDQALEQAKGDSGTEYDTVALEHICMAYLEGNSGTVSKPEDMLKKLIKSQGWEAVLGVFGETYPNIDLEVTLPEEEDEEASEVEDGDDSDDSDDDEWANEED